MYSIMSGDWKEDVYAVHRKGSPTENSLVVCGLTMEQAKAVRDELKLNRPDVGWYQVRNALKKRNESGDFVPVSFKAFEEAYKTLTEKMQPMVYELGFLKI